MFNWAPFRALAIHSANVKMFIFCLRSLCNISCTFVLKQTVTLVNFQTNLKANKISQTNKQPNKPQFVQWNSTQSIKNSTKAHFTKRLQQNSHAVEFEPSRSHWEFKVFNTRRQPVMRMLSISVWKMSYCERFLKSRNWSWNVSCIQLLTKPQINMLTNLTELQTWKKSVWTMFSRWAEQVDQWPWTHRCG